MDWSRKFQLGCQVVIDFIFLSALIFLTVIAIHKYIQQPISTHTKYTYGDDDRFIAFPQVVFCSAKIHPWLGDCGGQLSQEGFVEYIHRCLKSSETEVDIDGYLNNISMVAKQIVSEAYFEFNESSKSDVKNLFHETFHQVYGPCIQFDGDQLEIALESADQHTMLRLTMDFSAFSHSHDSQRLILFHAKNDSLEVLDTDVERFAPKKLAVELGVNPRVQLFLKKRRTIRDSTRKSPCGKYGEKSCRHVHGSKAVAETMNCRLPFINDEHLPEEILSLQNCNGKDDIMQALDIFLNVSDECKLARACMKTRFTSEKSVLKDGHPNMTIFEIKYADFEVKHEISSINYDLQSLICEIGGVIGMTLGFSGSSIGRAIIEFLKR